MKNRNLFLTILFVAIFCGCTLEDCNGGGQEYEVVKIKSNVGLVLYGESVVDYGFSQVREQNAIKPQMLLGAANGLAFGSCWGGSEGAIKGLYSEYLHQWWSKPYYWKETGGDGSITYAGGTGYEDSVAYIGGLVHYTPTAIWDSDHFLVDATLMRVSDTAASLTYIPIAYQWVSDGTDSIAYGDYVSLSWIVYAQSIPQSSHCEITDTANFIIIEGIREDNMPKVTHHYYAYSSGDTTQWVTSNEVWYNTDTTETRVIATSTDTARGVDTLIHYWSVCSDGRIVGWDTLDVPLASSQRASAEMTFYILGTSTSP